MKKMTNKQTFMIGFISILAITIFIGGYILTDTINRAKETNNEAEKNKISLIKNVPTGKIRTIAEVTKFKEKDDAIAAIIKKDTTPPVITAPEKTVEQYEQIDIYEGVTAVDENGGDLTDKISSSMTIDTSVAGEYRVPLTVTDSNGNTGKAERLIHVVQKREPAQPTNASDTALTAPEEEAVQKQETAVAATAQEASYLPMTLTINGQAISYQNGGQGSGQAIIDANPSSMASTWGGAAVQSGNDGQNTHFIGHNPGAFASIFSLGIGSQIVVTDANNTPTTYTVGTMLQLNDYGEEVGTGTNYWDLAVGTGGGERITLQSCINDDINLFVIAYR